MAEVVGFQSAAQLRGLLDQLAAGLLARRVRLVIRGATRPLAPELVFWAGEGRLCLPNGAGVASALVRALSAEGGRAEIAPLAAELWTQVRDRAASARAALDDAEARARSTERILAPWGGWGGPVERTAEGLRGRLGPIAAWPSTDVEPTTLAELLAHADPLDVVVVGLFGRAEGQPPSVGWGPTPPQGGPAAPAVEPVAEARGVVEPAQASAASAATLSTAVAASGGEGTRAAASVAPPPAPIPDPGSTPAVAAPPPPGLAPLRPSRGDRPSADDLGEWRAPSPWPWIAAVLALLLLLSWRLLGGAPPPPPPPTPDPVAGPPAAPPPPLPPSPSPTPVMSAAQVPIAGPGDDERLRRAEKLVERGRYEEAEGLLDAVERVRPDDPVLWMLWSHLRLEQGRDAEALSAIERSLKLDPRRFRAHVIRGSVLQLSGRSRDAIRAYRTALDLDSKHPMSPEIRGIVDRLDD